jgi:glycosyltransferase 2 family protein
MGANVGADGAADDSVAFHVSRARTVIGIVVTAGVIAAVAVAIYRQRHSFVHSLDRVGAGSLIASFACGLVGVGATGAMWWEVLGGLGVHIPWRDAFRVFFTSQLGKYLPGSVWPAVLQMEAGRARGASRRTMLGANLIALVMGCCVGLLVACVLLPFYDGQALSRYWWGLIALPFLLVMLHPRALPATLDRVFRVLGRPPLGQRLEVKAGVRAIVWSLVSWVGFGAHLTILSAAVGHGSLSAFLLCTGAMALAIPIGVLAIPAPAGAGVREVVLVAVLVVILSSGQALAVVVASRLVLLACDIVLAAVAALSYRLARAASTAPPGAGGRRKDKQS